MKGPRPLAELAFDLVAPACRRRGVANAALLLDPAEIFGTRFARSAAVERIVWPKGATVDGGSTGATLVVRADAAAALALQHVAPQVIERANVIIGWPAIARLRITQSGPSRRGRAAPPPAPVDPAAAAAVAATIDVALRRPRRGRRRRRHDRRRTPGFEGRARPPRRRGAAPQFIPGPKLPIRGRRCPSTE